MAMIKRIVMACACTAALTVASTTAMAQSTWNGSVSGTVPGGTTYGYWTNASNWSGASFSNQPSFLPVVDGQGYPVFMNDEFWMSSSVANAKMGALTLSSGTIQHFDGTGVYRNGRIGASGSSTFTQTGGVFYYNKGELRIGENAGSDTSSNGLYAVSGGTFSTAGGLYAGGNVVLNRNQASSNFQQGELRISGNAAVTLGQPVTVNQALRFGGGNGAANSAILSIIGSQANVSVWGLEMANITSTSRNGLLQFSFDQNGPSLINLTGTISGTSVPGNTAANLTQGYMHIDYTGTQLTPGQTFNLMTAATGTIAMNNSLFSLQASDTANWQLQLTNNSQTLQAVYVPEPSATVLLSFGAGAGVFVIGKLNRARNARASRSQA